MIILPTPSSEHNIVNFTLNNISLSFKYTYNSRNLSWYVEISSNGSVVVSSARVVVNGILANTSIELHELIGGYINVISDSTDKEISNENFEYGKGFYLLYLEA